MNPKLTLLTALLALPLAACGGNSSSASSSGQYGSSGEDSSHQGGEGSSIPVIISSDSSESEPEPEPTSCEIVFAEICDDLEELSLLYGDGLTLNFDIGTGQNTPKYYDNGSSARLYAGNTLTLSARNITKIEFVLGDKDGAFTADSGNFDGTVWTGDTAEVTFTVTSGQRRIVSMSVDYTPGEGGEIEPQLEFDTAAEYVMYFLEYREVSGYQVAPGISGIADSGLINVDYELDFYESLFGMASPYLSLYYESGILNDVLANLRTEGFAVPETPDEDYGYECKDDVLEIDVYEYDDSWVDWGIPEGTVVVTYYVLADLEGGDEPTEEFDTPAEAVMAFLEAREITGFTKAPVISGLSDDDCLWIECDFEGTLSAPYCDLGYAASCKDAIFAALNAEGFTVPETPDPDYGYECTLGELEVDVYIYSAEEAAQYELTEGTVELTFYAIADLQ